MGTRSVTHIYSNLFDREEIVMSFYRQYDGYPSGHGVDLARFLMGKNLVNGIGSDFRAGVDFNRAGTLAVSLAAHIQKESGAESIPTNEDIDMGQDYTYRVKFIDGQFRILFSDYDEDDNFESFELTPKELFDKYA